MHSCLKYHRLFLLLCLPMIAAVPLTAAPGDLLRSLAAPCKYPAGLATDGAELFVLDWRQARIHHVSIKDGALRQSWDAPTLKPHGLALGNGLFFISDDQTGRIYAFNPKNNLVEYSFEAPGGRPTGLAFAKDALFILETRSRQIYKVIPADGTILDFFPLPERNCTHLAYDGRYLWTVDRLKDEFYMLDPDTGAVLNIVASPGPHPAGIAFINDKLWNVDFQTREIYEIRTHDDDRPYRLFDTRLARAEYYWALDNYGPGTVRELKVALAVPQSLPSQKILSEIRFHTLPDRIASDRWGQPCALYECEPLEPGRKHSLGYSVDVRLSAIRYFILPDRCGTLEDIPDQIRREYTVDGERFRLSSPYVQQTARKIVGDQENPYWIARRIFDFLIEKLEYEMVGGWDVPEVVIRRGKGSCSEYTFAFIALCRAAGLPARYQGSVVVRGDDASIDEAFHRWAEIYLPNYGWVPVDANKGDAKSPADQCRGFGELENRFLITTLGGGGSEHLNWGYNGFASYKMVGYCNIHEEHFGFWEPLSPSPAAADAKADPAALGQCQSP